MISKSLLALALLFFGFISLTYADVSTTESLGTWVLKKGTSNVQTGIASYDDCKALARSKATTTATKYSCNVANVLTVKIVAVVPTSTGWNVTLSWNAPTQNVDGSALTDLAGYNIYYGTSSTALTQRIAITNPSLSSYVVTNLSPATWYFAMTAFNSAGIESDRSSIVSKTLQ